MTRTHRILIGVVVAGAVVIAAIGFAGSYAAVRDLAEQKGFGGFAPFFPIGIDAGIVVLLALDLLLTWIRIPFPMLRQTAWLLTAATIAFNGAAAWPDPLGVGMHAVIPVLFVVAVEAARHAVGRIADITADKHMEGVRISRWLLAFPSTFRLWRRMKLWELRSYDQVIRMEQDRLIYEARLRARYGRGWKRRAPVEALMPLRLARYGVPLAETGPAGLAAAGIDPQGLPATGGKAAVTGGKAAATGGKAAAVEALPPGTSAGQESAPGRASRGADAPGEGAGEVPVEGAGQEAAPMEAAVRDGREILPPSWRSAEEEAAVREAAVQDARAVPVEVPVEAPVEAPAPVYAAEAAAARNGVTVPVNEGGRRRPMGRPGSGADVRTAPAPVPAPRREAVPEPDATRPTGMPSGTQYTEVYYHAFREFMAEHGRRPNARELARALHEHHNVTDADGSLLSEGHLRPYLREFRERYNDEMGLGG
ncbi:DUF2637 domain-containing protein [Streptomyces radiopugnans]|uniref:DUF2637 domain-containing protein n=1 Tax=Streptomyces radiopugnans TaxID=403935 RepID=UPI000B838FEE|nr:DUF2637 domain-containing protein [Streptomyces radiopugnans]